MKHLSYIQDGWCLKVNQRNSTKSQKTGIPMCLLVTEHGKYKLIVEIDNTAFEFGSIELCSLILEIPQQIHVNIFASFISKHCFINSLWLQNIQENKIICFYIISCMRYVLTVHFPVLSFLTEAVLCLPCSKSLALDHV